MFWLQVIAALGVVLVTVLVASGRGDSLGGLPPREAVGLPSDRPVEPSDVLDVRFSTALRGYRMDEVDATLDRVVDELARRDAEIVDLRERLGSFAHVSGASDATGVTTGRPDHE